MADEENEEPTEPELDAEGKLSCGHTPEEHVEMHRHIPVGAVTATMTVPVSGYDPTDGKPIIDTSEDSMFGLLVDVQIPGPNALYVARRLLSIATEKIEAGIAAQEAAQAEGRELTEEEINARVAEFDPDAAIAGLLNGTYAVDGDGEVTKSTPKPDDDPPTGLYL